MFRKASALFLSLILLCLGALLFFHVHTRSSDAAFYRKLVQESRELKSKKALEDHPIEQEREGVRKDIYIVNGKEERLHMKIESRRSFLTIHQKKGKTDAIEELEEIFSALQEGIDPESRTQQVRTFYALSGTYHFPSNRFVANAAHLAFYQIAGFFLPIAFDSEKPFLTGSAEEVAFEATAKIPTFTAYRIRAKLLDREER